MKRRTLCGTLVVFTLCLILAIATSLLPLSAQPASSQAIAFSDTYSRDDVALTPADSLGATEPGIGQAVLDYRELGASGGVPQVSDIARIEAGSLVVQGVGTKPAFVELDNAGPDVEVQVDAEFLVAANVTPSSIANDLSFLLRNAGYGADGTVFTPGTVAFELFPDGTYGLRAFRTGMNDTIEFPPARHVDAIAFGTADQDHNGLLATGEPFTVRLAIQGTSFRFYFNGILQMALDAGLPIPPAEGDRLLFGRNRWAFNPVGVPIRFDNLRQGPQPIAVSIDIEPGDDANCVNNDGHGVIPVAVLGSATLDVAQIDPATVQLEGLAVKAVGKERRLLAHVQDVNGDGFLDLVVQVQDADGAFWSGSGPAVLTARLYDGTPLEGSDHICIVP
jgi:hypothetical protein